MTVKQAAWAAVLGFALVALHLNGSRDARIVSSKDARSLLM